MSDLAHRLTDATTKPPRFNLTTIQPYYYSTQPADVNTMHKHGCGQRDKQTMHAKQKLGQQQTSSSPTYAARHILHPNTIPPPARPAPHTSVRLSNAYQIQSPMMV